ncbi:MAG: hypothetical protein KAV82_06535 [Phycisphaerae bacterium]|nr:hypothetical protein [Phycisphaerae bacterium]
MSELGDIAVAISDLLSALESGGSNVFATVDIHQVADRKAATAAISRQLKPAAFVLYDGRGSKSRQEPVPAAAVMAVLLAVENLRGGDTALTGDDNHTGAFEVAELAAATLDGAVVETDYRLMMQDEHQVVGDGRAVVFEQRYRVERLAEVSAPTFDGSAIAGSDSVVTVQVGDARVEVVEFGFPGIDGVYRHHTGTRGREVRWQGRLVADNDSALNTIEADLDQLVVEQLPATMVDAWGRSYPECVLDEFKRDGVRRRHPMTGAAVQAFELVFTQLQA